MGDRRLLDGYGVGLKYPFQFANGGVALTANTVVEVPQEDVIGQGFVSRASKLVPTRSETVSMIKDSLRRIILVPNGSQFMAGESGSQTWELLYEINDVSLANLAFAYASIAVEAQEPRARVLAVRQGETGDSDIVSVLFPFRLVGDDSTEVASIDITRGVG